MIYLTDRITIDENICNGKPTIRGLRITAQSIIEYLSVGDSVDEILANFPDLKPEDITACLQFAGKLLKNKFVIKDLVA